MVDPLYCKQCISSHDLWNSCCHDFLFFRALLLSSVVTYDLVESMTCAPIPQLTLF
jgi:hypothetical protein